MPSSGEKTVSLSATTNDFFSDGNTDPGYIYYAQLRCGAKSKRWAEYSMDTSMDLNFIEVKAVTVLGGSNATGIQTAATIDRIDVICAGNGWPASIDVYESENLNIVAKKNGIFLRHINPIRDTSATMSVYRAQLTGDETTIEAQSINSTQPALAPVSVSSCRTNPYPPKPEIVSVKFDVSSKQLVVKTKNALDSDYIDIDNQ